MYHSFIKVDKCHHVPDTYLLGVLYSKACVKQIHDISDLRKCLIRTCFDFDWNVIDAGVTV